MTGKTANPDRQRSRPAALGNRRGGSLHVRIWLWAILIWPFFVCSSSWARQPARSGPVRSPLVQPQGLDLKAGLPKPFILPLGSYLGPQSVPPSLFEKTLARLGIVAKAAEFIAHFKDPKEQEELSAKFQTDRLFDRTKEYEGGEDSVFAESGHPVAAITGALTRRHENPGPVKKMWFLYESKEELEAFKDILERVRQENPGVRIVFYHKDEVFSKKDVGEFNTLSRSSAEAIFKRMLREKTELVLGSRYEIYEILRSLRDCGYARKLPFGFAGRRFVSVDIPRASLNPARLSDPSRLPHRKFLLLGRVPSLKRAAPIEARTGMKGISTDLKTLLQSTEAYFHKEVLAKDLSKWIDKAAKFLFWLFQGDSGAMRGLREKAQRLAAYIEHEKIDVLVIQDPETARVVGQMKREGYHLGLPVVWKGKTDPGDPTPILLAARKAPWQGSAPWVKVSGKKGLSGALREAIALERLPDNLGKEAGVPVADYEKVIQNIHRRRSSSEGKYRVHFLLTYGNGLHGKGDKNQYGHFALGIEDKDGVVRVWTVQYNDDQGGAFTGGGSDTKSMLTLGEYLYSTHYLPGTAGQAAAMGETSSAPVLDMQIETDEAGIGAMREMASYLNAAHLQGRAYYDFINKNFNPNCVSIACDMARAALFLIPDSGTHVPADKAVQMFRGFAQRLLLNEAAAGSFDLTLYDRAYHSGSEHYKIPNTPTGTVLINFRKPWQKMKWWEILWNVLRRPLSFASIPSELDAIAKMATRRIIAAPNSRRLLVLENPNSPVAKIRESDQAVLRLRVERPDLYQERRRLESGILKKIGLENFRVNPKQTWAEYASEILSRHKGRLSKREYSELERMLERFHALDVELVLSRFDEILHLNKTLFLKIDIADPLDRYDYVLGPLRKNYLEVLKAREGIRRSRRLLRHEQIVRLAKINKQVFRDLTALRMRILSRMEIPVSSDIQRIFANQVSEETFRLLKRIHSGSASSAPSEKGKK